MILTPPAQGRLRVRLKLDVEVAQGRLKGSPGRLGGRAANQQAAHVLWDGAGQPPRDREVKYNWARQALAAGDTVPCPHAEVVRAPMLLLRRGVRGRGRSNNPWNYPLSDPSVTLGPLHNDLRGSDAASGRFAGRPVHRPVDTYP